MSLQAAQRPGEKHSWAESHLFPAAVAHLPDGGIDKAQGLSSCQVQKVKAVIKPREGLWVSRPKVTGY